MAAPTVPNDTLSDLLDYAASLGFVLKLENSRCYSIHHRSLRRPVRVDMSATGSFTGAGIMFGTEFKSVRGLRKFLTQIASSARTVEVEC